MIANLVDYDWPLAMGDGTRTSLRDQLAVMERLSLFTHGQVHAMVPFDPMRQVAMAAGKLPTNGKGSQLSFEEIQQAVLTRGFIGVKLFPPMGFKPADNAKCDPSMWDRTWLPSWMKESVSVNGVSKSFGAWMDDKLNELFTWAAANEVPITSHTDASEGPSTDFDQFAIACSWQQVLTDHKKLRINFAHTASLTDDLIGYSNPSLPPPYPPVAAKVLGYMCGEDTVDSFAYGDLSYASGAMANPDELQPLLKSIFSGAIAA
jgi:hypothetical protein